MSKKTVIRSYSAKVKKCPEWEYLHNSHFIYNRELGFVIGKLFEMKSGKLGEDYQKVFDAVMGLTASQAHQWLNPLTSKKPWQGSLLEDPDGKKYETAVIVNELNRSGNILFDRHERFMGLSSEFIIKLFSFSSAKIKSNKELVKLWEKDKKLWNDNKANWLEENPEYAQSKSFFDDFESKYGKIRGKRRWAHYQDFLNEHKELKPLEKTHLYWNKNFRSFQRRPTYTAPDVKKHPEWYQFKKNNSYKNLNLNDQTVDLCVVIDKDQIKMGWQKYSFFPDKRIKYLKEEDIQGIKLIFKAGKPYLAFSCKVEMDVKEATSIDQKLIDKYSTKWALTKIQETIPAEMITTLAVDLGIRHIAAATIMKNGKIERTQFTKLIFTTENDGLDSQKVTLPHIAAHVKTRSALQHKTGRAPKGEVFAADLQRHITNMKLDRAKKSASRIVNFAKENGAHVIVFEKLQGFIPSDQFKKGVNKKLIEWNRRKIVEWSKNIAEPYGILIFEVYPRMTSQICNKCGRIGYRYGKTGEEVKKEKGGKLFACYYCGYKANADFNASVNLHKVFWGTFVAPKYDSKKKLYVYTDGTTVNLDKLEEKELGLSSDSVFQP